MIGKRKSQIHDQALLLMNEWNMILSSAANCLEASDDFVSVEEDATKLALYLEINILGVLTYIVAGLNHDKTATEMTEQYKRLFIRRKEQFNQNIMSENEAVAMVNKVYQQARRVSDLYMEQGKGLEEIIYELANLTLENSGLEITENNIGYFTNAYSIFYEETFQKFTGGFSSIIGTNKISEDVEIIEDEDYASETKYQTLDETSVENDSLQNVEMIDEVRETIPVKELRILKELFDEGIINDQEFSEKKRQLLGL